MKPSEQLERPVPPVDSARMEMVGALEATRDKVRTVRETTTLQPWVAPVAAGVAGLALALLVRRLFR